VSPVSVGGGSHGSHGGSARDEAGHVAFKGDQTGTGQPKWLTWELRQGWGRSHGSCGSSDRDGLGHIEKKRATLDIQ
jgi:hypothetical protein